MITGRRKIKTTVACRISLWLDRGAGISFSSSISCWCLATSCDRTLITNDQDAFLSDVNEWSVITRPTVQADNGEQKGALS